MFLQENRTKRKLKAGQPAYGVISTSDDPQLAEVNSLEDPRTLELLNV